MSRKKYADYLRDLDDDTRNRKIQRLIDEHEKKLSGKKRKGTTKRKSSGKRRRTSTGRRSGGGYGTIVTYPNVVGKGRYYIGGGFGYNRKEGWHGAARAYLTDEVSGLGAYNIRKNSLVNALDMGMSPPFVRNSNQGEAFILNHREYIGDLLSGSGSPTAFTLQEFSLNPGNSTLLPFLAAIARNFQEYEIRGMLFELKTLSTDFSTSFSLGSMFMAADYNVLGPAPTTKQMLENMEYASSSKPSQSMIMPIECDPRNNVDTHLYIAIDEQYNGGDRRLYDMAKVYIGSQGLPAQAAPIAEIWVTYEVALFKPIINGNLPSDEGSSIHITGREGINPTAAFGTNPIAAASENWNFSYGNSSNSAVFWPEEETGVYLVWYQVSAFGGGTLVSPEFDDFFHTRINLEWGDYFGNGAATNNSSVALGLNHLTPAVNAEGSYGRMVIKPEKGFASMSFGSIASNFTVYTEMSFDLWIIKVAPDLNTLNGSSA